MLTYGLIYFCIAWWLTRSCVCVVSYFWFNFHTAATMPFHPRTPMNSVPRGARRNCFFSSFIYIPFFPLYRTSPPHDSAHHPLLPLSISVRVSAVVFPASRPRVVTGLSASITCHRLNHPLPGHQRYFFFFLLASFQWVSGLKPPTPSALHSRMCTYIKYIYVYLCICTAFCTLLH